MGRRVDGKGLAPDLVSPGAEGCLESRVYGAGGRRVAPAAKAAPSGRGMQNDLFGWGGAVGAADAAPGSWAGTKQSDADRPMWVHVRFVVRAFGERTEGSL